VGVSQQVFATCMVYHGISERRLTERLTLAHFDCCQERLLLLTALLACCQACC